MLWNGGNSAGWQWSSGGLNGSNGSAVGNTSQALDYHCYGSAYGPITLTTPTISGFAATDTQYLDFDLYMPCNYYEQNGYTQIGAKFIVKAGTTTVLTAQVGGTDVTSGNAVGYGDATFYDGTFQYANDPSGYPSSTYWRHYHIKLPQGGTSTQLTFVKDMGYPSCYYYLWYDDDIAFDNVVVTNIHASSISVLGPNPLNFGNVPYLSTVGPYYTRLADSTLRTINLSNYSITGVNAGDFTIIRAPTSIAPNGGRDSIGITYTPHQGGAETATLNISTDDDAGTVVHIVLEGTGLRPFISLPQNPLSLFAHVHVRFGDTAFATLLISNLGLVPLHVSPASFFSGDHPEAYSIKRIPPAIGADQTDSMILAFSPVVEGLMSAAINIVSDASNGTLVVPLRGVGILARLDVNNSYQNSISMNFDSVAVGTDSCFAITLFNPGSDTLAIEKNFFSSADYDFTLTPLTGTDTLIYPQASKTIQVCFKPLKRGFRTAELRIVTNIPRTFGTPSLDTSQFSIRFTGTGVPTGNFQITGPVDRNGNDLVDSIPVGKSMCQTDTLWNTGEADLTVTSLAVSGPNGSEFMPNPPTLPFVLAAGAHQTFTVCATPSAMNDRVGMLTGIARVAEKNDTAQLVLDAYGVSVCTTDSIATNFPATTCVGDTSLATILVTNCGNVTTPYAVSIAGTNASDYSIVGPATSSNESSGGVATFTVAYHPQTNTASAATFTIAGGAGGTVALSGAGGAATIAGSGTAPITQVGSTSNFSATVANTGSCDWTPGVPNVGAPFSYVSGGTTAIPPGGMGTLNFTFAPTSAGPFTQPVTFPNSSGISIPVAAVNLTGTTESASVSDVSSLSGYSLEQNRPNPFAGKSTVEITLPTSGMVRLVIIDAKGELVQTVLDQRMDAGTSEVTLDASTLMSGTYYYQMTAGNVTLTRHMTVLK